MAKERYPMRFRITYMGERPIATKRIEDMFLPLMRGTHAEHAEVLYAIYLGGGAPERAPYDLEYAINCDADMEYWQDQIDWWREKMQLKVEINSL